MKKFENFCRAVENLEIGVNIPEPLNIVEETGLIKLFEICFEQTWKLLKEILDIHGLNADNIATPRKIFTLATFAGILDNDEVWLEILKTRNILIHTYDAEKAKETMSEIREKYLPEFQKLKETIQNDWLI